MLSWPPSPGATGSTLYVWDGATYEAFDLVEVTSWDGRQGLIYPADQSLYPNVPEAGKNPPVLLHNGAGLNLRDLPLDLYCTTATYYCTQSPAQNYWFTVAAYNGAGSSAMYQVPGSGASSYYMPTLPLQTDPAAPTITAWGVNGGGGYTYASTAPPFSLDAAYALSNDGSTWKTTAVSGCAVGQVAPTPRAPRWRPRGRATPARPIPADTRRWTCRRATMWTTATTVTVTENGAQLYSGAYQNTLTLTGSGYQMVQVTVTDAGGN